MDKIRIRKLKIYAYHGVAEEERVLGQEFMLDIDLFLSLEKASQTDELVDTVSYEEVTKTAISAFTEKKYRLIERAAGAVAEKILEEYPQIQKIKIAVKKPNAPIPADFSYMAVQLTRERGD